MNAIKILVDEHDIILRMIDVTRSMLVDTSTLNTDHVEQVVDFIKNFADKYHHLKEEDVLFVEMENHGMSRQSGPVGVMLHEHEQGRAYVKQAEEGILRLKSGDIHAAGAIKESLLNYSTLLTNHINKENNILYPMAERLLPQTVMLAMTENFGEAITIASNNEFKQKYLKMADELSRIYMK
ncbi:MAG: hemerythrin domain-containing protein [Paludibacteraceae bacterium]